MDSTTWFDLGEDGGVLEFGEIWAAPGLALELHILFDADGDATIAWWQAANGAWLGAAMVGRS